MTTEKLSGDRSRCPACGLLFTSSHAFGKHRVGAYAPLNKPDTRRCLTEAELRERGWSPNECGFWRKPAPAGAFARIA
jgi:hypothetical protein